MDGTTRIPLDIPRPAAVTLATAVLPPRTVRFPLGVSRPTVRRFGFSREDPAAHRRPAGPLERPSRPRLRVVAAAEEGHPAGARRTRLACPKDVVKLSERFFYLLQPDLETLLEAGELSFAMPPFPFQLSGMAFLVPRHAAVLADEMGLGKSMQAITAIRLLVRLGEVRRVLVVCPKGLVSNWRRELSQWAPELVAAVVEGEPRRRRWQWSLADVPVTIANYESVVRDGEWLERSDLSFDLVVLDEAQRIKNRDSLTSRAVRAIRRGRSWALTGTPVENGASDLVSIFEFVSPGLVDDRMSPRQLGAAVADHVMRRTKATVLEDLPPRMNRDESIELTAEQWESYRMAEEEGVLRLSAMGESATIQHIFELVLRLKQICNFDTATGESAKLERLRAELEEVQASGQKAIIFSQWVESLDRLADGLSRFGAIAYHGGLSTTARDRAIAKFRDSRKHSALLLTYGAGAVGLNLQFARYVFLFDRWWNPAVEDQAINRAHRIGAKGAVTVTRFLCADTIEERIDAILESKRAVSDAILARAESMPARGFTEAELFGLFGLASPRRRLAA